VTRPEQRGFTLIEVLIAVAITAVVAALALGALTASMSATERVDEQAGRIQEIERAWRMISRDMHYVMPRTVRDSFGETEPVMWGGRGSDVVLALTRGSWLHRGEQPRSEQQRVQYRLLDGVLWRETFPVLDRAGSTEPIRLELLSGVEQMNVRFLTPGIPLLGSRLDSDRWPDQWAINRFNNPEVTQLPAAVELRLELRDWGELRKLYALPQS